MFDFVKIWDIYHYWLWASAFVQKQPFVFEYPNLALIPMVLPRLLTDSYQLYALYFHIEMIVCAGLVALLIKKVMKLSPMPFLIIFVALFGILIELLDVYVSLITFVSVLLFDKKKYWWSAIFLCLASATKIYPLVLFPLFGIRLLKDKYKLIPFVISGILSIILIFSNSFSISFHKDRPVQPESIYGSMAYFRNPKPELIYAHNAIEYKDIFLPLWIPVALLTFGFVRAIQQKSIFVSSFYMILSFIVANKVLSPQYLIWIAPFIVFVQKKTKWAIIIATGLTLWYLGMYNQTIVERIAPFPWILTVRNFLLMIGLYL